MRNLGEEARPLAFMPIPASTAGLADAVYDQLAHAIINGSLPPGERLRINELAEAMEVSRTPVREALQRLARLHLVEIVASRETRVTTPPPTAAVDTFEYTGYQIGITANMAARRMTPDELTHAIERLDNMMEASKNDDLDRLYTEAREFSRILAQGARNTVLIGVLREAGLAMERNIRHTRVTVLPADRRLVAYQHIKDALIARDGAAAERWLRIQHGIVEFPNDA